MSSSVKRQRVNLTIRDDIVQAAKDLNLNASKAAEAGLLQAIKEAKTKAWREENRVAIDTHNARVEEIGVYLMPSWASKS
ncbi:MAG: type II toxin-antitoxin system CcdA family antitoxin [Pseudomonadota bacterium]